MDLRSVNGQITILVVSIIVSYYKTNSFLAIFKIIY